jgi:hypothetical protein
VRLRIASPAINRVGSGGCRGYRYRPRSRHFVAPAIARLLEQGGPDQNLREHARQLFDVAWLMSHLHVFDNSSMAIDRGPEEMDISGVSSASGLNVVSGASYSAPPRQKMSSLFDAIDTTGSGSITQAQFEQAFQTQNPPAVFQKQGASAIFSALDPSGTGSVSKQNFVSTMSQLMVSLRAEGSKQSGSPASNSIAASLQSLNQIDPTSISANSPPGTLLNYRA